MWFYCQEVVDVFPNIWLQEKYFLDLNNDNNQPICFTYSKGWNTLVFLTFCIYISLDWLQIILPLANIG